MFYYVLLCLVNDLKLIYNILYIRWFYTNVIIVVIQIYTNVR